MRIRDWSSDVCSSDLGFEQRAIHLGDCHVGRAQMLVLAIPDPPSRHANDRIFLNEAYNARMMSGTYELAILAKAFAAHCPLRGVEPLPRHAQLFQSTQATGSQLLAAQRLGPI